MPVELLSPQYLRWLLSGAVVTLVLSALVVAAAVPLGFAWCMARLSSLWPLRAVAAALLSLLRNSPLLVQLFFWYFALPSLLPGTWRAWLNTPHTLGPAPFGVPWPPLEYLAGFIGLALYSAAFFAEEFRAGVRAVAPAQWSAASALGLSRGQRWRCVVLPQAWRLALPTLAGQAMNVVKNTSLAMTIGVAELSYMARQVETQSFQAFQSFALATALYLAIIALVELASATLARRVAPSWQGLTMDLTVITDNLRYLLIGPWPDGPLGGAALTVLLSVASALASAVLGLLGGTALALLGPRLQAALRVLLGLLRAVPVLMLVFWIYFLLPIVFGVDIPGVLTVVVALSLVGGAYLGHAVAAGIAAVPAGQWQAGQALGLGRVQALRLVVLPQALPAMAPSFLNQWIALIKDTSLAYVIGVAELSFVSTQVSNRLLVHPAEIFLFATLVYFLLCASLEWATHLAARAGRPALASAP